MSTTATRPVADAGHAAKRSAALFSVVAALVITALKLITGILSGSLGMLSEAAHSTIDLVAAAITLFSIRVADRPADEEHNYGHGKIESLSAFVETVLMLGSCIWIVTEAVRRLFFGTGLPLSLSDHRWFWPFLVLLLSIAVDFSRSRALRRTAAEHHSLALQADAIHFSTDIWSSAAVLVGLTASIVGAHFGIRSLELADPIAALIVSAIILRVTYSLARRTVDNLLDATPTHNADGSRTNTRRDIFRALGSIEGVLAVDRLRIRQSGPRFFADVTLGMPRSLTFQRSEQITAAATAAVQQFLPDADVVVHSVPTASKAESTHDRVRAVAARSNLSVHDLTLQQHGDALHLEQHLEVDEAMPLRKAHDLVTRLESEIRREVPEVSTILTHIESEPSTIEQPASFENDREIELRLRRLATSIPDILDIHDVRVTRLPAVTESGLNLQRFLNLSGHPAGRDGADRIQVTCHCTLPDDLPMAEVHAAITALESAFKADSPEVVRLLIHPEPATDNCR